MASKLIKKKKQRALKMQKGHHMVCVSVGRSKILQLNHHEFIHIAEFVLRGYMTPSGSTNK